MPALLALRDGAGADALSDPALMTEALLRRLIADGAAILWDNAGGIAGFAAVEGAAVHLLVDPDRRGGGLGRALLAWGCAAVRAAGHDAVVVSLPPGGTAERHYRAAGWVRAGATTGGPVLKKPF
ncbi:MAG TPA: GNAT family N-acetyltransferase [Stellaceae bacterium]|nr:GNAT family N-acetyltransferase [Stellaceae bacterium]